MELMAASNQWSSRPADERFANITEMDAYCAAIKASAKTAEKPWGGLKAVALDGEVKLSFNPANPPARLTNFAFGQLAQKCDAPAGYLRTLPAELAATCLNNGIAKRNGETAQIMAHVNGSVTLRSITSDRYDRIWNADITRRLVVLARDQGWINPPAYANHDDPRAHRATADDVAAHGGASIVQIGTMISSAGLYASDRDMFAFMIDPQRHIADGSSDGLYRGFYCWNSEVGDRSFGLTTFYFRVICGNHIIWSASNVSTVKIRHIGDANERAFRQLVATVETYREQGAGNEEALIARARTIQLGTNKEEVLDRLFGMRLQISKGRIEEAYTKAVEFDNENNPRSVYGMVNGLTRVSQSIPFANERVAIDAECSKVMALAS